MLYLEPIKAKCAADPLVTPPVSTEVKTGVWGLFCNSRGMRMLFADYSKGSGQ